VPPVLFGLSSAPTYLKRYGRRKFTCHHLHDTERLRMRTSANLPFHRGENRNLLVSGASPRLLAWTASQVGVRMTKINEARGNLRNGASLPPHFAAVPLRRGRSPRLLYQAEIGQGCIRQHLWRMERRVADPQFSNLRRECHRPLPRTPKNHLSQ
jgi:hypothetical protein